MILRVRYAPQCSNFQDIFDRAKRGCWYNVSESTHWIMYRQTMTIDICQWRYRLGSYEPCPETQMMTSVRTHYTRPHLDPPLYCRTCSLLKSRRYCYLGYFRKYFTSFVFIFLFMFIIKRNPSWCQSCCCPQSGLFTS